MPAAGHILSKCAACGKTSALTVAQGIEGDRLVWSETFACVCGHGFEAKGEGFPSPYARKGLFLAHGYHRVLLTGRGKGARFLETLAVLVGEQDAKRAARPGTKLPLMVYEGTLAECQFMAQALQEAGATVQVQRFDPRLG